jgi:T-complex protein 1 subunit eta
MDKLIYDDNGKTTISNDGATIMNMLDIVHPAARTLVDIAKSQDAEVGDGTTSVVLLAGEFLKESKQFVEDGLHSAHIIKGYRTACSLALQHLNDLSISIHSQSDSEQRSLLEKCAQTALNSKLIAHQKEFFGEMAVDAVLSLEDDLNLKMIGVKKVAGGSLTDSVLVKGVAFKKTFSYAGFEQQVRLPRGFFVLASHSPLVVGQPKKFSDPLICLLNVELELKSEKDNAEVRIKDVADYQAFVDAEWKIIYDKLDAIVATGAKVVLSRLAIGDLATQYFADRDIFCAGRVTEDDMERVAKATGGAVQNTCSDLIAEVMGKCGNFEEVQVGAERYNFFKECPEAKTATIVLRGGAEQFIEEAHRSLHDAICIVRRAMKHSYIVPGGGAIEMELSKILRAHSRTIAGKQQLVINAFAKALEVVPRMISQNAGFDSTDILNKLRQKHAAGGKYFGVDIMNDGICDTHETFVWEPANIKQNAISSAVEVV